MSLRPFPSRWVYPARLCFFGLFLSGALLPHGGLLHAQAPSVSLLQQVSHLAGTGTPAYSGDSAPAASAAVNLPLGAAFDGGGNLYIADTGKNRVRCVDAVTGIITIVVGIVKKVMPEAAAQLSMHS